MTVNRSVEAGIYLGGEKAIAISERQVKRYVLVVVLLPILFLVSAIPIVRSAAFPGESGDPFIMYSDYPFSLKHVDCEIVIVGDSTASTGIDPTVVEKVTGLKSCTIAESQSIVEILGLYALDTYLRNNAAPKYIVMQFSPEVLTRDKEIFWPEGLTLLFRQKPFFAALPVVARHPVEFYNFAMWAIKAKVRALYAAPADFPHMNAMFKAKRGLINLPKPPETSCTTPWPLASPSEPWVRRMRETYSSDATRVVIDVAPVPECTQDVQLKAKEFENITDNALPILPIDQFCDNDRHLTLSGAEMASARIGAQILHLSQR